MVLAPVSSTKIRRRGVEVGLAVEPASACGEDVRALLLGRVRRLFLNVMSRFLKKACTDAAQVRTPCSTSRRSAISASVMSRSSVSTKARMKASCGSSFETFGAPCRPGSRLPVARQLRYQEPAVEMPMAKRRAASRVDSPSLIASITRLRRSKLYARATAASQSDPIGGENHNPAQKGILRLRLT